MRRHRPPSAARRRCQAAAPATRARRRKTLPDRERERVPRPGDQLELAAGDDAVRPRSGSRATKVGENGAGASPGRGGVTSRHSRGRDETRSRSAGLAILAIGVLGRVRRDEDGTRHREPLPPMRLLWVELRQAGQQPPGLDCKKPYRGKNSPGITVCHDPLLGPAARDTADRLFLWGHPPPTSRGRPASAIAPPGVRLDQKLSSTGSSMTAVHSRIVSQRWCAPLSG